MRVLFFLALMIAAWAPREAAAQNFQLPIDCRVGDVCVVQNYTDANPASGAADDPRCGPLTYDGHDGIDIRAPALMAQSGVAVLSPAAGVIAAIRDGEEDGAFRRGGVTALNGRDCGNGVRIDHADGWSTQLCHMRNGSIRVRAGDRVTAGQAVGLIGLSGRTEFTHVHMALRRNNETLDPLTGNSLSSLHCGASVAPGTHWSAAARSALAYRGAQWFATGFTGTEPGAGRPDIEALPRNVTRQSSALVFWALATGPLSGDILRVRLYGPNGQMVGQGTLNQLRNQAQAYVFGGRRAPPGGLPAGAYRGEARIERGGRVISTRTETITIR